MHSIQAKWRGVPDSALLGVLLLVGLAIRVWALNASGELGADEAIPGLMARHIAAGHDFPVFYYGQPYFGALEAYLIAGLFAVFGFHAWLISLPPLVASLLLIPLTWALAARIAPPPAGLLAALPVAIPPPALARLFGNSGGGFSLAFALQAAAVLCCLRAYDDHVAAARWASLFWLATGLAAWVWQPALIALPPLMLPVLMCNPRLRRPVTLARSVAPIAVGLIPPLVYNAAQGWPTLSQLARYTGEAQANDMWRVLFLAIGGGDESSAVVNPILLVLVVVAFLVTPVVLLSRTYGMRSPPAWKQRKHAVCILLLFTGISVLTAHQAVRHVVPAVLVGYALAAAMLTILTPPGSRMYWIPAAVMVLVIGVNVQLESRARGLFPHATPSTSDVDVAIAGLDARGLRTGYADYWSAYPLMFVSGEHIIVAPRLPSRFGARVDRYPAYTRQVNAVDTPAGLFALVDQACEVAPYIEPLDRIGATYRIDSIARWYLVWNIQPGAGLATETLAAWRAALEARQTC